MSALRAATCAAVLLALAGCGAPQQVDRPPRAVLVGSPLAATAAHGGHLYAGEVRAQVETDLAFRIPGKLAARPVQAGQVVRAGEVLAHLDPADVKLAAGAARAALAAAEAEHALAQAELQRAVELHARGFISASALDTRRTALDAAQAAERAARAQADSAGNQAGYAELRAARDYVVLATLAEPGAVLAAGQAVLRVAEVPLREVLIHVPESRIGGLAVGAPAVVRGWAQPAREFAGVVRELSPVADPATRSFAVRVALPDAGESLALGATASVALGGPVGSALKVPLGALGRVDGKPVVWRVDADGRAAPQAVEVLAYREDGVEISAELPADARLVVSGVHLLVPGETVRPVDAAAPVQLDLRR